jgi:hypothetical protein
MGGGGSRRGGKRLSTGASCTSSTPTITVVDVKSWSRTNLEGHVLDRIQSQHVSLSAPGANNRRGLSGALQLDQAEQAS